MKVFVVVSGTLFGLLVLAHAVRLVSEPHLAKDPFFVVATIAAAALSLWAWRLVRHGRPQ